MADDLPDEVKVFRSNDAEEQQDAQNAHQLTEDKKEVVLETELESRPSISENLLNGKEGPFKPTPLPSPRFHQMGMIPSFSPSFAQPTYVHPALAMNPLQWQNQMAAAVYASLSPNPNVLNPFMAPLSPGYQHLQQLQQMQLYNQILTSPKSPLYAHMTNMRAAQPLNQMNNMLYGNNMGNRQNTIPQATTPKRVDENRVKKPLNAFMWFMKKNRNKLIQESGEKEQKQSADLNKELGAQWRSLSKEEQQPYFDLAKNDKERHKREHPTWSAKENYAHRKPKKRKREKSEDGSEQKKCRALFGMDQKDKWCKSCGRKKKCELTGGGKRTPSSSPSTPDLHGILGNEKGGGGLHSDPLSESESEGEEEDNDQYASDLTTLNTLQEVALLQDAI